MWRALRNVITDSFSFLLYFSSFWLFLSRLVLFVYLFSCVTSRFFFHFLFSYLYMHILGWCSQPIHNVPLHAFFRWQSHFKHLRARRVKGLCHLFYSHSSLFAAFILNHDICKWWHKGRHANLPSNNSFIAFVCKSLSNKITHVTKLHLKNL